jgi:hypothetical protein
MQTLNSLRRRGLRAALVPCIVAVAVLATGCSDPFKLKASYSNEPFTYSVYGLSGSGPSNAPAALDLVSRTTAKVDGSLSFDIAFDFDKSGKILIVPQHLVGTSLSGARTVYLQRVTGTYEALALAPTKNWLADSAIAVLPGEPVAVKLVSSSCVYQYSSDLYAKIVIDSVKANGLVFGRGVIDPNCGFRSFAEGIPDK